ncbi:MAG: hypothetical protein IJZ48_00505 [Oscillospiraceae bacterium]|nr:hypothetical protein [Oscillospiraceae bacterium]
MKKAFAFVLSLVMMLTLFAGCGVGVEKGGENVVEADPSKASITVATWDGGLGSKWLEDAAALFEEQYKDATNFEEGKVGVEINIVASRSFDGSAMAFTPLTHDIYFVEAVDYFAMINNRQLADISDVVTAPLTAYGEEKSIADKLDPTLNAYLTNIDGNYYAVPFYETYYSFAYDLDLWDAKSFYVAANGGWTNASGDLSAGPDGVAGTDDDGMPATYAEFAKLITRISDADVTPFVTAGNAQDYVANYLYQMWADYEGAEQMLLNYTFDGTATDLIDVDESGNVTKLPATEITIDNGYMLQKQAGRYAVLQFCEDILLSSDNNYKIIDTHVNAQKSFVRGGIANDQPIAMIVEGSWWENEAKEALNDLANGGYDRHNYAVMPMPHATEEQIGQTPTWLAMSNSYGFVASNCDNMDLAKEFMKFLHTDSNLCAFTREVNMTRALQYELSQEQITGLTTYCQSILNLKKNGNVIYPVSLVDEVNNNNIMFANYTWAWQTNINGYDFKSPWLYFKDEKDTSAEKYFNGQYNNFEKKWPALF